MRACAGGAAPAGSLTLPLPRVCGAEAGERFFDQELRFRTGHEHAGADLHVEVPELPMADDVPGRLAALAPSHERFEDAGKACRTCVVRAHEQLASFPSAEGVARQHIGVEGRFGGLDARLLEAPPGVADAAVNGVQVDHGGKNTEDRSQKTEARSKKT